MMYPAEKTEKLLSMINWSRWFCGLFTFFIFHTLFTFLIARKRWVGFASQRRVLSKQNKKIPDFSIKNLLNFGVTGFLGGKS